MNEDLEFLKWILCNMPIISDGEDNGVSISTEIIPAGSEIQVVSMRNAIFMDQRPWSLKLDIDFEKKYLNYEGGVWMTNHPQELNQMSEPIKNCLGHTLVGGLGLGMFSDLHANYHNQFNVTVEKDQRIVNLVEPDISSGDVIVADLFEYVKDMPVGEFDSAFFDIWHPTGEAVWVYNVVPLRRLCRGKIDQKNIYCWNEKEMQGQLKMNLHRHAFLEAGLSGWLPSQIISKKGRELGLPLLVPSGASPSVYLEFFEEAEKQTTPELRALLDLFILSPATDEWEREFGELWDEFYVPLEED